MAKFDFNSSRYAKFFASKENNRLLQTYLDTEGILYTNYTWYQTQGRKAGEITPTKADGTATFTIKSRSIEAAPLMNLRAPLGAGMQIDQNGIEFYSASIPDLAAQNGMSETALEREDKVRRYEMFGDDSDIVEAWTEKVQGMVDAADATLTFMTAQVESTGCLDYSKIARGIHLPLHKANIPAANFTEAYGDTAWTDPSAAILTRMSEVEDFYRNLWGYKGACVWQFQRDFYRKVFLKNNEVRELVTSFRTLNDIATTETMRITPAMFNEAFVDYPGVSPIQIVEEKERNITNTVDEFVNGWNDNIAVFRPAGDAVEFQYADLLDKQLFDKYGSSVITKVWASTNNGLATLVNTTRNDGEYKKWSTDLFMQACPALIDFPHHVIVDMSKAKG